MRTDGHRIRLGRTLASSWGIFRKNFWRLAALSGLAYVPSLFMPFFLHPGRGIISKGVDVASAVGNMPPGRDFYLAMALSFTLSTVCFMATAWLVEQSVLGRKVSLTRSLKIAAARLPAGLATLLLAFLVLVGWSLLLVIPGLIWGLYYVFWAAAVALRGFSLMAALRYSKRLVKGRWWNLFWIFFVVCLLLGLLIMASTALPMLLPRGKVLAQVANLALYIIGVSFFQVLRVHLFLTLEGQDAPGLVEP